MVAKAVAAQTTVQLQHCEAVVIGRGAGLAGDGGRIAVGPVAVGAGGRDGPHAGDVVAAVGVGDVHAGGSAARHLHPVALTAAVLHIVGAGPLHAAPGDGDSGGGCAVCGQAGHPLHGDAGGRGQYSGGQHGDGPLGQWLGMVDVSKFARLVLHGSDVKG